MVKHVIMVNMANLLHNIPHYNTTKLNENGRGDLKRSKEILRKEYELQRNILIKKLQSTKSFNLFTLTCWQYHSSKISFFKLCIKA